MCTDPAILVAAERKRIRCELTEAFYTKNERSAKTKSPAREIFAHSIGNLPGRRIFQASNPKKCNPMSAGKVPRAFERGGLANPFYNHSKASRQSCPLSKLHQQDHRFKHTAKPTATGGGYATEPKPEAQSQYSAAVFVPVCSASCNAYLHARSDHSNP
jgi:hypothetical protein